MLVTYLTVVVVMISKLAYYLLATMITLYYALCSIIMVVYVLIWQIYYNIIMFEN